MKYAVGEEVVCEFLVLELPAIVTLERFYDEVELSLYETVKDDEYVIDFRFGAQIISQM